MTLPPIPVETQRKLNLMELRRVQKRLRALTENLGRTAENIKDLGEFK